MSERLYTLEEIHGMADRMNRPERNRMSFTPAVSFWQIVMGRIPSPMLYRVRYV